LTALVVKDEMEDTLVR